MASCTVRIKTEISEPSLQDQSKGCNKEEIGVLNQQDGVTADQYQESDINLNANKTVGHVKSEADDDTQGYTNMFEDSCLGNSVKSEFTDNQNCVKIESIDSLIILHNQGYTSSRTQLFQQDQEHILQNAINVVKGAESMCDEDNLNTSDEEAGIDSGSSDANQTDSEPFNNETYQREWTGVSNITNISHSCEVKQNAAATNYGNKEMSVQLKEEANTDSNEETHNDGTDLYGTAHILNVPNVTVFECSYCPKRFETKRELIRHTGRHKCWEKRHKNQQSYECDICSTLFTNRKQLLSHYNKQHPEHGAKYECSLCQKKYITYSSFKIHMDAHKGIRHTCNLCDKSFVWKISLQNHMQLHDSDKDNTKYLTCDICHKLFAKELSLYLHMQIHTGIQQYNCKVCDARFSRAVDLQRHEYSHTGEKPYKCTECGKGFRNPGSLGRHRHVHGSKYMCKVCSKSFTRFDSFNRHIASHVKANESVKDGSDQNKTVYPCSLCSNVLSSELNLLNHMKRHERMYPCSICKNVYRSETSLLNHIKSHERKQEKSTEAPDEYPCDQCEKVFSTHRNRGRHIRRNHPSEDSIYTCDICSKDFSQKYDLKMHTLAAHFGKKPHPCPHCSTEYHRKDQLGSHIKREHSKELGQKHS